MALPGKVALVTGASRGIGKGIALQLGEAGATVYITGRTVDPTSDKPGSLSHTAKEIESRGGKVVAVACDHSKDCDVAALFQRIEKEQGRLDILVNNAYSGVDALQANFGKPFWEIDESIWDTINNVGLRNTYICAVKAARLMTKQKSGLIVNLSSFGGEHYIFTPAYGIGKAATDRLAKDCALELKAHNVTCISLWPGPVKTELIMQGVSNPKTPTSTETLNLGLNAVVRQSFAGGESTEFSGKCIVALAQDPNLINVTGQTLHTSALGEKYNLLDIDGRKIEDIHARQAALMGK